jgi:hypothetical protein
MSASRSPEYEFDVAISFAGSDREIARVIARVASASGLRVFIDESHASDMWGKNLVELLSVIYDGRAEYCVILISEEYVRRPYTRLERRHALDRAIELRREYILPVRLDDAWLEGLPRSTAYLDYRNGRMTPTEIGQTLVEKLRGIDALVPADAADVKVARDERAIVAPVERLTGADAHALAFVHVQPLADERDRSQRSWEETSERMYDDHGSSDPAFDVTVLNRAARSVVLTGVGVEFVSLGFYIEPIYGGGGASVIDRHRTYQLDLPDLWVRLGEIQRAAGVSYDRLPNKVEPVPAQELVTCKVPAPVLLEAGVPYRFGLQLFNYHLLCPNRATLRFWVRTDAGEDRSLPVCLQYFLGSHPIGHTRYGRALGVEDVASIRLRAYRLWEQAGRPEGRDVELWHAAKAGLAEEIDEQVRNTRASTRFVLPPDYRKLYSTGSDADG